VTEGFFIYEAPKKTPKDAIEDASKTVPLDPSKSILPRDPLTGLPKSSSTGLATPLLPEPGQQGLVPSPSYDPYLSPEPYRARNADKLITPPISLSGKLDKFGTLQDECQRKREQETGLSLIAILGAPDFEAKFARRLKEVVAPCMRPRPF
jgi:hypothetical protein